MLTSLSRPVYPFPYYGGKVGKLDFIRRHLNPANQFIDIFGGSAAVCLNVVDKYKSIVYNDINSRLYTFFKVLREHPEQLIEQINLSPYSREEYVACKEISNNSVEEARRCFVRMVQGFSGLGFASGTGWSTDYKSSQLKASASINKKTILREIANRMNYAVLENKEWRYIVERYGNTNESIFFADPPYDLNARNGSAYIKEFTEQDHIDLGKILEESPAQAIVCGYRTQLYDDIYSNWDRHEENYTISCSKVSGAGERYQKTECLWVKPIEKTPFHLI